jgi:hypothetical protein
MSVNTLQQHSSISTTNEKTVCLTKIFSIIAGVVDAGDLTFTFEYLREFSWKYEKAQIEY